MRKWAPNFRASKVSFDSVAVWVRVHELLIETMIQIFSQRLIGVWGVYCRSTTLSCQVRKESSSEKEAPNDPLEGKWSFNRRVSSKTKRDVKERTGKESV
ncbi:hypothetical protein J1N35_030466 [Gossypium stocksii]|uniref:DUF4283 domain-containing protein n=1 Tax=Gossypium stocksii TaxID=47602 RepID=A0A9D3V2B1_9ROSI|nr:hypothetical protein J1N35_030466 [Gossypium stocksii]